MSIRNIVAGAAFAICALIVGHPTDAAAQATRTWVSGVGDDVNPCSRTAPCKTFAGAISKTAPGGIIDVLDPGGFGTVTITKSITIRGSGTLASILGSGTNGVNINSADATVNLIGLKIDGAGTTPGNIGVNIINGARVLIEDCEIVGFKQTGGSASGTGVKVASSAASRVKIRNTLIYDGIIGVDVAPSGSVVHNVVMENVWIDTVTTAGIRATGASAAVVMKASNSRYAIELNGGAGFSSYGDNALPNGFTPPTTLPLR